MVERFRELVIDGDEIGLKPGEVIEVFEDYIDTTTGRIKSRKVKYEFCGRSVNGEVPLASMPEKLKTLFQNPESTPRVLMFKEIDGQTNGEPKYSLVYLFFKNPEELRSLINQTWRMDQVTAVNDFPPDINERLALLPETYGRFVAFLGQGPITSGKKDAYPFIVFSSDSKRLMINIIDRYQTHLEPFTCVIQEAGGPIYRFRGPRRPAFFSLGED